MKKIRGFWLITALLLCLSIQAKTLRLEEAPKPLQPWIDWVLQDNPDYRCPFLYDSFEQKRCSWPSQLTLDLVERSAEFWFDWKVFADSWVQLPGDLKQWPLNVSINEKPAPVMERQGLPYIKLRPGYFSIHGSFLWDFIPDNLVIPEDTGLIALKVNGKVIDYPLVKQGQLWLKGGDVKQSIEDKLDLQVFRRIDDDVPLQILTRLELQVAGEPRELKLAHPMLESFVPMRLSSPLPARIEADGSLLLQLRPGRWRIDLQSRHVGPVEQLGLQKRDKPWPQQEIWVFAAYPDLRLVEIENVRAIDAQLTNLPEDWKSLPAYRVESGDAMRFKVIRRGDPEPEPDHLNIERRLWLDFDGKGYTVNDKISGAMTHSWRLNALSGTQLGKVSVDGDNQLITRLPDSKQNGIEVRKGELDVSADSRLGAPIEIINAAGWEQSFYPARAVLNLPPGWRLLAAKGVDNVPDSWISRWTMLDFFLVLIASFAISRLWNIYWAGFALLTLALIWHEVDAPRFIWLNILAALALLRVLPPGRLYSLIKFYRNASGLVLLVLVVLFMKDQVRMGLYPQLEKPWQPISPSDQTDIGRVARLESPAPAPAQTRALEQKAMQEPFGSMMRSGGQIDSGSSTTDKPKELNRVDPDANVQTGPGLPQWQWTAIELSWNGPIDSVQEIRFWYLSPGITRLCNFMRALLVAVLALLTFGVVKGKFELNVYFPWLLIVPLLSMPSRQAQAAFPDQELLNELKSRLLQAPDCLPSCAQISQMALAINPNAMTLALQVDIQERVAFPLPGQARQWMAQSVSIAGKQVEALYRTADGVLWVNLDPGQYQVLLQGMTQPVSKFSLPLPLNPHRVVIKAEAWLVEGLHENRSPDAQLQFTRQRSDQGQSNPFEVEFEVLPPFVRVERTLHLSLDWRVDTRIIRITPPGAAVVLEVPLLTGESVTTAGIHVKEGKVLVNMPADQQQLQWQSVLEQSSPIKLVAAQKGLWSEVWSADISPIWHMQSEGIAVVHHQDQQGHWLPEWRPWPGEAVALSIGRPEAVSGQTLTIDNSHLQLSPGERVREATLNFTLRSSQGTQHIITLPEHAILQSVTIDQLTQAIRQQGRQLTLPIRPGSQEVMINWREAIPLAALLTTPELNLGIDSVNSSLTVVLGQDRWTLLTSGPALGPAVLFWGILLVIAALSIGLGKIPLTPLRYWQWFLLLFGLSQIPVESALFVVAWLIVLGFRSRHPIQNRRYFNVLQIGIVLLTLISLSLLIQAVNQGLLGSPEMSINGNQSSAYQLNWYQDRSQATLLRAKVVSIPLTAYRILMLAWSLWLARSLLNWLKWGWICFSSGGFWKKAEPKKIPPDEITIQGQQ
ncbi:MAG: hypothetical protein L0Y39_03440 [Methylococcaceae bacterium]|nr:hypothetical protein [Methylococcaceae bacterium]